MCFPGHRKFYFGAITKTVSQGATLACQSMYSGINPAIHCTICLPLTMQRCFTTSPAKVLWVLEDQITEDCHRAKRAESLYSKRGSYMISWLKRKFREDYRYIFSVQPSLFLLIQNQFFSVGARWHSTDLFFHCMCWSTNYSLDPPSQIMQDQRSYWPWGLKWISKGK